ncbi:hypothetical protein L3Y34_017130 [Caenorhabditis briggsae]|uniref:Uncharacterized protein n=1 Tax=Caenorhabditis briggsae TaxID=6238 RepID=A0AAE9DGW7_CAEBR|nr:hypothetical protein L3Y34_017130 [Caenorhabditis briggsae]
MHLDTYAECPADFYEDLGRNTLSHIVRQVPSSRNWVTIEFDFCAPKLNAIEASTNQSSVTEIVFEESGISVAIVEHEELNEIEALPG